MCSNLLLAQGGLLKNDANMNIDKNLLASSEIQSVYSTKNLSSGRIFQQTVVSGSVTDATNSEVLPGVSVGIKGTNKGTITDSNGKYSLEVNEANAVLVFSYVGYLSEEIPVNGQSKIDAKLAVDLVGLDEVVVVGYGTSKKRDLTGAVSVIRSADLNSNNPLSIEEGLQGKIAGVNIIANDGTPGGGMSIIIRGANTFSGSGQPLFVVDGVPVVSSNEAATPLQGSITNPNSTENNQVNAMSFLDPKDIESVEVLKDASATAIYGSRGANGVVLVTTKSGKTGQMKVDFSADYSLSNIRKYTEVMSAAEYTKYINDVDYYTNYWKLYDATTGTSSYVAQPFDVTYPGLFNFNTGLYEKGPLDYSNERNVWQKAIIHTAQTQKYSLGFSGGSKTTTYTVRFNHVDQGGIVINTGYKRDGLNFNLNQKASNWLSIGATGNVSFMTYNLVNTANANDQSTMGLIKTAIYARPIDAEAPRSFLDEGGFWATSSPLAYVSSPDENNETNVFGNLYAEISFLPTLKLRSNLGYNLNRADRHKYYGGNLYEGKSAQYGDGFALEGFNKYSNLSFENTLTYDKSLAKHNFKLMGTLSMSKSGWDNYSMNARGFGSDITQGYDMGGAAGPRNVWSAKGEMALMSYLGRFDYNYANKYYFTSNIRRDGASNFAKNNKWATFYSFVAAYNLAGESFMKDFLWLDLFKIRYSYGYTGNQGIGAYASLAQYISTNYPFGGYIENGYILSGTNPGNANLKWETTKQQNLGADISVFKSRLNITVDAYYKHTYDLLQYLSVAMSNGVMQIPMNVGEVENKGLEFSVSGVPVSTKNFTWNISANWSANRNKVLKYKAAGGQTVYGPYKLDGLLLKEGHPMGQLYGYLEDGYWNSNQDYKNSDYYAWIAKHKPAELPSDGAITQAYLGEIKYKDINGDSILNESDRTMIGNVNPGFIYGFTNNFTYKNLSLNIFFQGVYGNDILNAMLLSFNSTSTWENRPPNLLDNAWTPERAQNNPGIIKYPKMGENLTRTTRFSRRYVEDGSYLKLKSVSLSYKINKPFKLKYLQTVTLTVTGTNLLTFTKYTGFDPEVNSIGSGNASWRGIDVGAYPSARTYTFSVNVLF